MLDDAHNRLLAIERKLSGLEMNPAPTVPIYNMVPSPSPIQRYLALQTQFKSIPHWWGTDDTYADNTTLPRWFDGWSAFDIPSDLAVVTASGYTPVWGDMNGFWTPGAHPPGYVGPTPTPFGSVGNGFTNIFTSNFSSSPAVFTGDTLQWIGGHIAHTSTDLHSDPYMVVRAQVVDQSDHSIVYYDFGEFHLVTKDNDVTALVDASGNSYAMTYPPGSVWTGPSWVVT